MRPFIPFALVAILALSGVVASSAREDSGNGIQQVEVTNFPSAQEVRGQVSVTGRLSHSAMDRRESLVVPPANRNDTTDMLQLSPIVTDGFTSLIISLQGESKSSTFTPGTVGIILVPDEAPIMRAFTEDQKILFPFEAKSTLAQAVFPYFTSSSEKLTIGFPRYRVFAYNTTGTTVELNVYIYLTH